MNSSGIIKYINTHFKNIVDEKLGLLKNLHKIL